MPPSDEPGRTAVPPVPPTPGKTPLPLVIVAALGIVYGDIGTSPLYALRECFIGGHGIPVSHGNILGLLSLIFWTLTVLVCGKYLAFVMRADNHGEGGILALMTLVNRARAGSARLQRTLVILGLFGACLLYADAIITPAISVLSAVEGLNVTTRLFEKAVVPISLTILTVLFLFQYRGTARIGAVFGPIMVLWFAVLAVLGIAAIVREPVVLAALNPAYAVAYFVHNGWHGFPVLGSVFLIMTGGEVLYADMGHFGRRPIRLGWFWLVFPALLLNYFGQGAYLLGHPGGAENLFYRLAPGWGVYPLVALATMATVIASQAVISGAFSLTRQAVQLNYCPRLIIRQTSAREIGQVYVPAVNRILLVATVFLILGFRESGQLAAAYGVAVATTMLLTTVLLFFAARRVWGWSLSAALGITGSFLVLDLAFLGANLLKIQSGGWLPLATAGALYLLMESWNAVRLSLKRRLDTTTIPLDLFLKDLAAHKPRRVAGTAVVLTGYADGVPRPLLHNFKHNKVLHEQVVLLTVRTEEIPFVSPADRWTLTELGAGFYRLIVTFGFSEDPSLPNVLRQISVPGLELDPHQATYFLGRDTIVVTHRAGVHGFQWQKYLFAFLNLNALDATKFFGLPPNRVIEIGAQVEI